MWKFVTKYWKILGSIVGVLATISGFFFGFDDRYAKAGETKGLEEKIDKLFTSQQDMSFQLQQTNQSIQALSNEMQKQDLQDTIRDLKLKIADIEAKMDRDPDNKSLHTKYAVLCQDLQSRETRLEEIKHKELSPIDK